LPKWTARGTPGRSGYELLLVLEIFHDFAAIQVLRPGVPRAVRFPNDLGNTPCAHPSLDVGCSMLVVGY
jgi:hypothetical protein